MKIKSYLIIILLLVSSPVRTQTKTNLEGFYSLIDNSVLYADSLVEKKSEEFTVVISLPPKLELLKTRIIDSFITMGYHVSSNDSTKTKVINYSLENAETDYYETFKNGLFGDHLIKRKLSLAGSVLIEENGLFSKPNNFVFNIIDTVSANEIQKLENRILPFTTSTVPEPRLMSNLLEPILVVGTLIVTIILFFTVRGK